MTSDKKLSKPVGELGSHLSMLLKNSFCHPSEPCPETSSGSPDALNSLDAETSSA